MLSEDDASKDEDGAEDDNTASVSYLNDFVDDEEEDKSHAQLKNEHDTQNYTYEFGYNDFGKNTSKYGTLYLQNLMILLSLELQKVVKILSLELSLILYVLNNFFSIRGLNYFVTNILLFAIRNFNQLIYRRIFNGQHLFD